MSLSLLQAARARRKNIAVAIRPGGSVRIVDIGRTRLGRPLECQVSGRRLRLSGIGMETLTGCWVSLDDLSPLNVQSA